MPAGTTRVRWGRVQRLPNHRFLWYRREEKAREGVEVVGEAGGNEGEKEVGM